MYDNVINIHLIIRYDQVMSNSNLNSDLNFLDSIYINEL